VLFRLLPGQSRAYLSLSAEVYSDYLQRQPGFLGREVLQAEDGTWHELIRWSDPPASDAADAAWARHPLAARRDALLAPGTLQVTRLLSLRYDEA
jgi:hypothetical protein